MKIIQLTGIFSACPLCWQNLIYEIRERCFKNGCGEWSKIQLHDSAKLINAFLSDYKCVYSRENKTLTFDNDEKYLEFMLRFG